MGGVGKAPKAAWGVEIVRNTAASRATYLNGRGERSQTDRGDLNVPLVLSCELMGAGRWSRAVAG
jgi:hypothetical protein